MADPTYIGVPLPEYERRVEAPTVETSGGTTVMPVSPEQAAVDAERERLLREKEANAETVRTGANADTQIDVDYQNQLLAEKVRQAELDRGAMDKSNAALTQAREHVARKQKEFAGYKPQNFFHSESTWGNALRGLAAGLGDAVVKRAAVAGGHAAPSIDTVQDIINNDLRASEMQISKMKDEEAMARTGLADAADARSQLMADRKLAAAAAYDRLAGIAASRKAARGFDNNNIRRDEVVAAARAGAHKERQEAADLHAPKVDKHWQHRGPQVSETFRQATPGKGPTESQAKLAGLSGAMADELKTIKSLPPLSQDELAQVQDAQLMSNAADSSTSTAGAALTNLGRAVGMVPRTKYEKLTPVAQKSMNAWDTLVELRARQLTGAGMPETEAIREARTLGYSPGDTPEMMQQKITRLENEAARGVSLSGQAGEIVSKQSPPAPTQPPPFVPAKPGAPPPGLPPPAPAAPTPSAPPPPPTADPRAQAIQLLKTGKVSKGLAPVLRKRFNITDQELR